MQAIFRAGLVCLLIGVCALPTTFAQTPPPSPPPPPCQEDGFKQFDFWLGTWEVEAVNGQKAGENVIQKVEGGCLITESWTNTGGGTGQSMNFYNPVTDEWRQVWVSAGTIIDYTGGLTETGSMLLKGTITYTGNGTSFPFTGEWTPNDDGTVTQHFEQYDPEADDWKGWFTGIYKKKSVKL